MKKTAVVSGAAGQDGAYLCKMLLSKGYSVLGIVHRKTDLWRLDTLAIRELVELKRVDFYLDSEINSMLSAIQPQEFYHLAAQSSVAQSLQNPMLSGEGDAIATLKILEGIRQFSPRTRFFNASSAEIFCSDSASPQDESSFVAPRNPYACAKAYGYHICATYRLCYGLYCCSAILFNHESPLRGEHFVTRKVTSGLARLRHEDGPPVELGGLDSRRDWGYAEEYVVAYWKMLQSEVASDYVLATGKSHSVREFCEYAAIACGFVLQWRSENGEEFGYDTDSGRLLIRSRQSLIRENDTRVSVGNPEKALRLLKWRAEVGVPELARLMVDAECQTEVKRRL